MRTARADDPATPARRSPGARALASAREAVVVVAVALVVSLVVKTFLLQAFSIPSASMHDTLVEGDRIVVDKLTPGPLDLHRGDVVVFTDPGGWLRDEPVPADAGPAAGALRFVGLLPDDSEGHLVKRVVGIGGDHVVCCDAAGLVTVDGTPVDESGYLAPGAAPSAAPFDVTVPRGELWVMGDNRGDSADSRAHPDAPHGGFVPVDLVVGRARAVVWPVSHWSWLGTPSAFDDVRAG